MSQPFLNLGDVSLVIECIGRRRGSQTVNADRIRIQPKLSGILDHHILIDRVSRDGIVEPAE